jgi:replicative DNA helicase
MDPDVAQYEAVGKELLRRCLADETATDLHAWLSATLARFGGGDDNAALTWPASFDYYDALLAKRDAQAALPLNERRLIDWPWASWNSFIDPLEAGMLVSITAPDGQGKTIVVECLAEHWARRRHKVVFVHYELNWTLMLDRRTARHTSIPVRTLKSGIMSPAQRSMVAEVRPRLLAWEGDITYLHTPGWTMERTVAELRKLHAAGACDVAVIDYLEKAQPSKRQLQMYGSNTWEREADNVEQLKVLAEAVELPVVMVAQMSKAGKDETARTMDRNAMSGSASKSNKANVVILLRRERMADGNYSPTVHVQIDKNTMGGTGGFDQVMQPEFFRLGDVYDSTKEE